MGALSRLRDPVGVGYCRAVLPGAAHTSSFSGSPQIPPRAELVTPRAVILQGLGHTALLRESSHTVWLVGCVLSRPLLKGRDPVLFTANSPALSTESGTWQG